MTNADIIMRLYKYLFGHKIVNAAKDDIPTEFAEEMGMDRIFGTTEDLPTIVDMISPYPVIVDQSQPNTPDTTYACGSVATTGAVNANNASDNGVVLDYVTRRQTALDRFDAQINAGSSMTKQLEQLYEEDLISSHYFVNSGQEAHQAIAKGHALFSGSNQINWKATRVEPFFVVAGNSYGHFFRGARSDSKKKRITRVQSYGKENYDKGLFHMRRDQRPLLYTTIALVDKQDGESTELIQKRFDEYLDENPKSGVYWEILNRNRKDLNHREKMLLFFRVIGR